MKEEKKTKALFVLTMTNVGSWNGKWTGIEIARKIAAKRHRVSNHADMIIIASLMRREQFKDGIYNYRGTPTTIKSKR